MGQMAGQGPQVAIRGHDLAEARDLAGFDRHAAHAGFGGQQGRDRLLTFFRLQRTGAIDQRSARLEQRDRPLRAIASAGPSARRYRLPAAARRRRGDGGWCRSRCRARPPAHRRSRHCLRPGHSAASVTTSSACSESRARLSRSRAMRAGERSTAVTRAPACASCAVLPPGAAQRSTIGLAADVAEQPRRQRGGGILHPPLRRR